MGAVRMSIIGGHPFSATTASQSMVKSTNNDPRRLKDRDNNEPIDPCQENCTNHGWIRSADSPLAERKLGRGLRGAAGCNYNPSCKNGKTKIGI